MTLESLAFLLRRAIDEVAVCRRVVAQTRDQLIAAEIAAERAALTPSTFAECVSGLPILRD